MSMYIYMYIHRVRGRGSLQLAHAASLSLVAIIPLRLNATIAFAVFLPLYFVAVAIVSSAVIPYDGCVTYTTTISNCKCELHAAHAGVTSAMWMITVVGTVDDVLSEVENGTTSDQFIVAVMASVGGVAPPLPPMLITGGCSYITVYFYR